MLHHESKLMDNSPIVHVKRCLLILIEIFRGTVVEREDKSKSMLQICFNFFFFILSSGRGLK